MKPTERFQQFAGQFVRIPEAHCTVYVPAAGEYDEDDIMYIVEDYHPMEFLEEGHEFVGIRFHGKDRSERPLGFVAVSDEDDLAWVYEDGNDEPLDTAASALTLELDE